MSAYPSTMSSEPTQIDGEFQTQIDEIVEQGSLSE